MYNEFFYDGPSTGDIVYEEVKRILQGTIKQEFLDEMEKLRKENEELRPFRDNKYAIDNKLREMEAACERRIAQAEQAAKELTFEQLWGANRLRAWKVSKKMVLPEKCDKCDSNRKIHFKSPSGKELTEPCVCAEGHWEYFPEELFMVRFSIRPDAAVGTAGRQAGARETIYRWYSPRHFNSETGTWEFYHDEDLGANERRRADDVKTDFKDLNEYWDVFTNYARCQAYCKYLQEKHNNAGN